MTEDRRGSIELKPIEFRPANADKTTPDQAHFEIGLVLAGAVSAGAYIAGVLDFLIEALDAWEEAKRQDRENGKTTVPNHQVTLKVITGASGGAMTGAITASVLGRKFPHIRMADAPGDGQSMTGNPFFDAWVQQIDIAKLLTGRDIVDEKQAPPSVLDSSELSKIVESVLTWPSQTSAMTRPWVSDPLRVFLTVTNLRGVPYGLNFGGQAPEKFGNYMMLHRDHVRFALGGAGVAEGEAASGDETLLEQPVSAFEPGWARLGQAALASGAFPGFLKARAIAGLKSDYDYRVVAWKEDRQDFDKVEPSWESLGLSKEADVGYGYLNVDGGAMDNEPLELARIVLAGARGRNPREGDKAKRATILVDPFVDAPRDGPTSEQDRSPINDFMRLFSAYKSQARFRPEDIALASEPKTYSRFVIAPSREAQTAPHPLAAGAFGGFGGFLARDFRVHDYLLGRRNAQGFLKRHLTLPDGNPLFDGWKDSSDLEQHYREPLPGPTSGAAKDHRPIIPLVGATLRDEDKLPRWPRGGANVQAIANLVEGRAAHLFPYVEEVLPLDGFSGRLVKALIGKRLRRRAMEKVREAVIKKLQQELAAFKLL